MTILNDECAGLYAGLYAEILQRGRELGYLKKRGGGGGGVKLQAVLGGALENSAVPHST